MNTHLANLEVRNGIYYVHAKTQGDPKFLNKTTTIFDKGKLKCNLNEICDVEIDTNFDVHHLPLNITDEPDEGERLEPIDYQNVKDSGDEVECVKIDNLQVGKTNVRKRLTSIQLEKRKIASKLWHRRLAHASAPYVFKNSKATVGMEPVLSEDREGCCEVCAFAKFIRKSFIESREQGTRVGQIVHADIIGPISPVTFHTKKRYILIVIDGYSRYLQAFVMSSRTETSEMLDAAYREIQAKFPGVGQFDKLRCDKGGEFESNNVTEILRKYGAIQEFAETDVHEHNGTAERMIRTIEDRLRALLFESGFPTNMWGQLVDTASWIYNRTVHSGIDHYTPYEKYFGKPPKISNLRIIGSKCFVYIPKLPRGKKLEPRSKIQYLVGYTSTGYRTYDPVTQKTTEQCLIQIDETILFKDDFPTMAGRTDFHFPKREAELIRSPILEPHQPPAPSTSKGGGGNALPQKQGSVPQRSSIVTRSKSNKRNRKTDIIRLNKTRIENSTNKLDSEINYDNYGRYDKEKDIYSSDKTPKSYIEAMKDLNWQEAIQKEIDAWKRLNVFELVPKVNKTTIVPTKWLFTIKNDGSLKARVVAAGNLDTEKYSANEKRSPTPGQHTVRWFLAHAIRKGWPIQQIDIDSAFLNGKIDREKFIRIPSGFPGDPRTQVGRLNRPLYGLPIAPMCWHRTLNKVLLDDGFSQSPREHCVYVKSTQSITILMLVYVDDILIASNSQQGVTQTIDMLETHFRLKRLGFPQKFIGFQIEKLTEHSILLHQESAIDQILKDYTFNKDFYPNTPMREFKYHVINNEEEEYEKYPVRKIIGSFLYLANTTRLDIAYSVGYIARHQANPQPIHHKLISHLLSYLNCHRKIGLVYHRNSNRNSIIELYADADFAADRSRISTTGYIIRYHGSVIQWASRLQSSISESSAEAELRALTDGTREAVFLVRMQQELLGITEFPIHAYEDNKATYENCIANVSKGRLKHVETVYFKVKEYEERKIIELKLVGTCEQLADILTKPLEEKLYVPIRQEIMIDAN